MRKVTQIIDVHYIWIARKQIHARLPGHNNLYGGSCIQRNFIGKKYFILRMRILYSCVLANTKAKGRICTRLCKGNRNHNYIMRMYNLYLSTYS